MVRKEKVTQAMVAFAVLNLALWLATRAEDGGGMWLLLALPLATALVGRAAVRRHGATWQELCLAFVAGLAPLGLLEPMLVFTALSLGGSGLFLLPLFSKTVRREEATAVPLPKALGLVACIHGGLLLIATRYVELPAAVFWMLTLYWGSFPIVSGIATALGATGHTKASAWVGALGTLCLWSCLGLLLLLASVLH